MPDVLPSFLDALEAEDDLRTEEAATALSSVGDAALPTIRRLLNHPDPQKRWWAPRALAAIGTDAAVHLLLLALDDPNPDVRACAVVALSKLSLDEAIEPLVASLSDSSAYVGQLAADALSQIGPPAVGALIAALQEGDVPARGGAARALSAIQDEAAIPALYEALSDPSATVAHYAEEALKKMRVGTILFRP